MRQKWYQYFQIEDRFKTYNVIINEMTVMLGGRKPQQPPKDQTFFVIMFWEIEELNTYISKNNQGVTETMTLKEKRKQIKWVGLGEWSEANEAYHIQPTDNLGLVILEQLHENMVWSVLPYKSTYSQVNYKIGVKAS